MRARLLLASALVTGLVACAEPAAEGPAGQCAEVVRIYRDLQGPVSIVGQPEETSEGTVEIEYAGTDAMNLPVRGSASCTFAVGGSGSLSLLEAVVEGSLVSGPDLDAIRKQLERR